MKKVKILIGVLFLIPILILNVKATTAPYQWIVGGEYLDINSPQNYAGTAKQEKDGKTITLYLNNYNGNTLKMNCYGTGQSDMEFIIDLKGNNVINATDIGIDMGEVKEKIKFQGDGDLKINAIKPISYENYANTMYINPSNNQYGEEAKVNNNTANEQNNNEVNSNKETTSNDSLISNNEMVEDNTVTTGNVEKSDNKLITIFGIYAVASLLIIIILAAKLIQKNKNE